VNKIVLYIYHAIIAILTPLNWSCPMLRDSTVAILVNQNGFGMEAVKNIQEESLEQVCLFLFVDYEVKNWCDRNNSVADLLRFCRRV
jgi:hypothetical protein